MSRKAHLFLSLFLIAGACQQPANAETAVNAPEADLRSDETGKAAIAIFAGGCFWGVEGVFSHVRGVTSAVSGYHGGKDTTADYHAVSLGGTGHAEAVRVRYDPSVVRYDELLRIYFSVVADPTLRDRQGPDIGTQYRSALIPLNPIQIRVARAYLDQIGKSDIWKAPIATRIEPYSGFFPAEGYHQDFMLTNPDNGYIRRWDAPKVVALRRLFPQLYSAAFTRG